MQIRLGRMKAIHILWFLIFFLLLFQDALTKMISVFSYTDEFIALLGPVLLVYQGVRRGRTGIKKNTVAMMLLLLAFAIAGLMGNMIYQYQPLSIVFTDLLVNFKFYFMILTGVAIFVGRDQEEIRTCLTRYARMGTAILFVLLLADILFQVFPSGGYRYGLRVSKLFYNQPTYLAGAATFLMVVLTLFYEKKNIFYLVMLTLLLLFTLRIKAVVTAVSYLYLFVVTVLMQKKLRSWHIVIILLVAVTLAWDQFSYYFIELEDGSARSALTKASFQIMGDYFPIGTGFGTFASHSAVESYSPVYYLYGLNEIWGLSENYSKFSSDTFWPIIFGQTGVIGTVCYAGALGLLIFRVFKIRKANVNAYAAGVFAIAYLLISSLAEPAFNNLIAIPLAMIIGYILTLDQGNSPATVNHMHEGTEASAEAQKQKI